MTDSLAKSTWYFLDKHNITLKADIKVKLPRRGDKFLMEELSKTVVDSYKLFLLNLCRFYLRAIFLSDIVEASGSCFLDEAWTGQTQLHPYRKDAWPAQGKPPEEAWVLWCRHLTATFIGRGRRLRTRLGKWVTIAQDWEWYFCPAMKSLFQLNLEGWHRHNMSIEPCHRPMF